MAMSVEWCSSKLSSLDNGDFARQYSHTEVRDGNQEQGKVVKKKRVPVQNELRPMITRKSCIEDYDQPITDRECWWRQELRETPGPMKYDPGLYLTDQTVKRDAIQTSSFASEGRVHDCQKYNRGAALLPGAYELKDDILARLGKSMNTYTFHDSGRKRDVSQIFTKDKNVNVSPNAYKLEAYLAVKVDNKNVRHPCFKSITNRFPTIEFVPKEGPPPGFYETPSQSSKRAVRSSFLSKTPRFNSSHTRVPGPGSYEKTFQFPQTKTIERMAKRHGIFFSSAYQL